MGQLWGTCRQSWAFSAFVNVDTGERLSHGTLEELEDIEASLRLAIVRGSSLLVRKSRPEPEKTRTLAATQGWRVLPVSPTGKIRPSSPDPED
jgi:hypothetical protein